MLFSENSKNLSTFFVKDSIILCWHLTPKGHFSTSTQSYKKTSQNAWAGVLTLYDTTDYNITKNWKYTNKFVPLRKNL